MEARRPELLRALNAIYVGRAHHEGSGRAGRRNGAVRTLDDSEREPEPAARARARSSRSSAPVRAIPSCSRRRARTRLAEADVVLFDALVSPAILALAATRAACRWASATAGTR